MIGLDLFSGAGGMSLGAIQSGINVISAVEQDYHAAKTFQKNHPSCEVLNDDIRHISNYRIKQISKRYSQESIVFGGPPCQGFSYSNTRTRKPDNENNWLFKEFVRFVRIWKPDWVVFENVRGIVNTANGLFLDELLDSLDKLKYTLSYGTLNSKYFGVPQDRSRFFLVGSRENISINLPSNSHLPITTVNDAVADLPDLENGATISILPYGDGSPSNYARKLRRNLKQSPNHLVTRNSETILKRYQYIPPGGNWENIPKNLMRNYKDYSRCHTGIYHRLDPNAPSIVIGNFRKNMLIHPSQNRGLSVREAARIQSFPDDYEFLGSIGFQQQQVGNSVPPLLAKYVFRAIISQSGMI